MRLRLLTTVLPPGVLPAPRSRCGASILWSGTLVFPVSSSLLQPFCRWHKGGGRSAPWLQELIAVLRAALCNLRSHSSSGCRCDDNGPRASAACFVSSLGGYHFWIGIGPRVWIGVTATPLLLLPSGLLAFARISGEVAKSPQTKEVSHNLPAPGSLRLGEAKSGHYEEGAAARVVQTRSGASRIAWWFLVLQLVLAPVAVLA